MRCVYCIDVDQARAKGRVEGFYIAAGVLIVALLVGAWLCPWLVGP